MKIFRNSSLFALLILLLSGSLLTTVNAQSQFVEDPDPLRFEEEINRIEEWDSKNSFPENAILFVGSSSIRLWKTADAFPEMPVINRGFGGSHFSDLLYFYDSPSFLTIRPLWFYMKGITMCLPANQTTRFMVIL